MIIDRSKAPEFRIPNDISLPKPTKRTLLNGVPLYFIPSPEIDAIKVEINSDSKKSSQFNQKKLSSYFTLHLMMEGTQTKSSADLDDFFDTYASEVEVICNFEHNGLSLLTTKKHFEKVLPVFRELLTEAIFPEKEILKRKTQKALSISIQKEQNSVRSSHLFRNQLFGPQHPYGQIVTESDVDAIQRPDLVDFYQNSLWVNTEIFVTGNLGNAEIDLIVQELGSIPITFEKTELPHFLNESKNRIHEEKPKSLQSSLRIGCHLMSKTHPDYFAISVFNTFLGGYFGSRLIKNIREEKGHTYGIYSSIGSLKNCDYWVVMADVQKEYIEEVIEEIYKELEKLQNQLVPKDELEVVRNYLIGKFLSNFSSAFDLIGRFKSIHQAGLDFEFFSDQLKYIRTFTAEDIQVAGQKYLDRNHMVEVIVG